MEANYNDTSITPNNIESIIFENEQESLSRLVDKRAACQVLGSLIINPGLLGTYNFEVESFYEPLYKLVFSAVLNLYTNGAVSISAIDLDNYCQGYKTQYKKWQEHRGMDFVDSIKAIANLENFDYYYQRLQKFACLRNWSKNGLDVSFLYNYKATDSAVLEREMQKLDNCSVEDLIAQVEERFVHNVRSVYSANSKHQEFKGGDGLEQLKEHWKTVPDIGLPFVDERILTSITRGARLGTVSIYSGGTGSGKTRMGYAKMISMCVKEFYDFEKRDWDENHGMSEPVLIMQTELGREENQSIPIAYVSGVNETKIRTGQYTAEEEMRIDKAIGYIKKAPLYFDVITDFSISDITNTIRKYHRLYGVNHFFFDYIQTSPAMLAEAAKGAYGVRVREDNVLLFAITQLKNLATELQIYLHTATQLNGEFKNVTNFADQTVLRGAKSLADKIDVGDIMMPVTEAELKATMSQRGGIGYNEPNIVNHLYKLRGGKFSRVKLFQKVDLGTCRAKDLFCTTASNQVIDIPILEIENGTVKPNSETEEAITSFINTNSKNLSDMTEEQVSQGMTIDDIDEAKRLDREDRSPKGGPRIW